MDFPGPALEFIDEPVHQLSASAIGRNRTDRPDLFRKPE
jgi:hypothetical protein